MVYHISERMEEKIFMKKNTLLSLVSVVLGAAVYLTCLLPAISYKVSSVLGGSETETVTFYKMFDSDFGMGIAIMILLSVGVVALIAGLVVDYLKANKKISLLANALGALLLVVAGVLFFFVTNGYELNGSLVLVEVKTSLGFGAIISAILAILGGAVAGYNAFLQLKK